MKYSREEITKAVTVIKDTCDEMPECCSCPFYDSKYDCVINAYQPDGWEIINEEPKIWRAFES